MNGQSDKVNAGPGSRPEERPPESEDGSGMLSACLIAVLIGAALIFAFRFLMDYTPLGDVFLPAAD